MKRVNILYIFITVTTIVFFSATAAICNFCGLQPGTESGRGQITTGTTAPAATSVPDTQRNDTETTATSAQRANNNPVILHVAANEVELDLSDEFRVIAGEIFNFLVIAEDEDDDELSYSVSDSNGNNMETVQLDNTAAGFGWVAPTEPGLYEIYITVSDDEGGSATATVKVTVNELAVSVAREAELIADASLSGSIRQGEAVITDGKYRAGDTNNNKQLKGYLSFDISGLRGVSVLDVRLDMPVFSIFNNPGNVSESLNIKVFDYGDSLDLGDFVVGGTHLITFNISATQREDILSVSENAILKNTLQDAINANKTWYQLKLGLLRETNNDNSGDYIIFDSSTTLLKVSY